jgi:hypothetical protein
VQIERDGTELAALDTPDATAEPALSTPFAADETVLQADNGSSAISAVKAIA